MECHEKDCEQCWRQLGHYFICPDQEFVDDVEPTKYDEEKEEKDD